jgi:imidazole glycerol-phosphate synthase subunit HisH
LIAVLDYGSGNLHSAERAFSRFGIPVTVTSDSDVALNAAGLVVPGVGAFATCMKGLLAIGGDVIIKERLLRQAPVFGICVGMQILFDAGLEKERTAGLGVLPGEVSALSAEILPHMGWNTVETDSTSELFADLSTERFYFVHSYAAKTPIKAGVNTFCTYGERFLAAIENGPLVATQFHPEKSGEAGLALISHWIKNWLK